MTCGHVAERGEPRATMKKRMTAVDGVGRYGIWDIAMMLFISCVDIPLRKGSSLHLGMPLSGLPSASSCSPCNKRLTDQGSSCASLGRIRHRIVFSPASQPALLPSRPIATQPVA